MTYFDVYGVWINIMIPETSIVSKLAHHAEIAICISIGITLDNSRQKLCILRMSNLRNKMHTIQNSSIIHQIPLDTQNQHPDGRTDERGGGIPVNTVPESEHLLSVHKTPTQQPSIQPVSSTGHHHYSTLVSLP